jgi:hypothetical protein
MRIEPPSRFLETFEISLAVDYILDDLDMAGWFRTDGQLFQEWFAHLTPQQRRRVEFELDHGTGMDKRALSRKAFVKQEFGVPKHPEDEKWQKYGSHSDPRLIQGVSDAEFLHTGRYVWIASKAVYRQLRSRAHGQIRLYVTTGLDGEAMGALCARGLGQLERKECRVVGLIQGDDAVWMYRSVDGTLYLFESDDSRFDAHITEDWHHAIASVLERFKGMPRSVTDAIRNATPQRGAMGSVLTYNIPDNLASGTPYTTFGDNMVNCIRGFVIWNEVMALEEKASTADDIADAFMARAIAMGFSVKFRVCGGLHDMEFCSGLFWPSLRHDSNGCCYPSLAHGPKPGRLITKFWYRQVGVSKDQHARDTVVNGLCGAGHVPMIRELLSGWYSRAYSMRAYNALAADVNAGRVKPTVDVVKNGWCLTPVAANNSGAPLPATVDKLRNRGATMRAVAMAIGCAVDYMPRFDDMPDLIDGLIFALTDQRHKITPHMMEVIDGVWLRSGKTAGDLQRVWEPWARGKGPRSKMDAATCIKLLRRAKEGLCMDPVEPIPCCLLSMTTESFFQARYSIHYADALAAALETARRTDNMEESPILCSVIRRDT